jgi:hypothetical protein
MDYRDGYAAGRKDTARAFAKAELEGKVHIGRPLIYGSGMDISGCWFISGSISDPIMELYGNHITLMNFYIDMVDMASQNGISVSPYFVGCINGQE